MVDKKACKVRKRKYKINGALFVTRLSLFLLIIVAIVTVYNKFEERRLGKILESSAYIEVDGTSSMVKGVQNGAVYTDAITPIVTNAVERVTLSKNGEEIKFRNGKKISKMGSYILTLEDNKGNVDTVYFDIEY